MIGMDNLAEIILISGLIILTVMLYATYAKCYADLARALRENERLSISVEVLRFREDSRDDQNWPPVIEDINPQSPDLPDRPVTTEEDLPF